VERSHKQPHNKETKVMQTQLSKDPLVRGRGQVHPLVDPLGVSISRQESKSNGGGDHVGQVK